MQAYVVIATRGRAKESKTLLDILQRQSMSPAYTVVVGTEPSDLEGLEDHPLIKTGTGEAIISSRTGATAQRNVGMEILEQREYFASSIGRFFCTFFDDDYRPDQNWLKRASERLTRGDIIGLTGLVLADGVGSGGLTEDQARTFLNAETSPQPHWASGTEERNVDSVYGCNMAFLDIVVRRIRFDENLPLYGWQEDRDYTGMAKKFGRAIYYPNCRGVHLGVKSGRTSGIRFGYSQIANPLYLMKKGTMGRKAGLNQMLRNMTANIVRSLINTHPHVDYKGRLWGNGCAIIDALKSRSDPRNILKLN